MRKYRQKLLDRKRRQRGIALLIALFALLLLSAVAMGMMFMANTETSINSNYRDAQRAYFASQAGLEEARERLHIGSQTPGALFAIVPPTNMPTPGDPSGVIYITNPARPGEEISPWSTTLANGAPNPYVDDEFCHEFGVTFNLTPIPPLNTPCQVLPAGNWYTSVTPSMDPFTNTSGALNYKWVRITLKANNSSDPYNVNGDSSPSNVRTQVCFQNISKTEILISRDTGLPIRELGPVGDSQFANAARDAWNEVSSAPAMFLFGAKGKGSTSGSTSGTSTGTTTGTTTSPGPIRDGVQYASGDPSSPDACQRLSKDWYSVYLVTSLAVTPTGARRLTQYEITKNRFDIPTPAAFTFGGPNPSFQNPSSNAFTISGLDSCPTGGTAKPALGAYDDSAVTTLNTDVGNNQSQYPSGSNPPVQNVRQQLQPDPNSLDLGSVTDLNELTNSLEDAAKGDGSYANTAQGQTPVWGTASNPKITFVDGDATIPDGANGIIVITGNATINGQSSFTGLLLVIGNGVLTKTGGGGGTSYGAIIVANTKTGVVGDTPGPPTVNFGGGGNSTMNFNSCAVNQVLAISTFRVVSYRELTY